MNLLTNPPEGRLRLKSAIVLVYKWVRVKHACVDLTRVFPTCGIGDERFYYGTTTLEIASSKMTKHEKTCSDNQSNIYCISYIYIYSFLKNWFYYSKTGSDLVIDYLSFIYVLVSMYICYTNNKCLTTKIIVLFVYHLFWCGLWAWPCHGMKVTRGMAE